MDKSKFKHPVLGCRARTPIVECIRGHPRGNNVGRNESPRGDWIRVRIY